MSPRFASITKPVACAVVFHSVSNARVLSIWIVTTPVAMRSRVCAQVAGAFAGSGAPIAAGMATCAGAFAALAPAAQANNPRQNTAKRVMRVLTGEKRRREFDAYQ